MLRMCSQAEKGGQRKALLPTLAAYAGSHTYSRPTNMKLLQCASAIQEQGVHTKICNGEDTHRLVRSRQGCSQEAPLLTPASLLRSADCG